MKSRDIIFQSLGLEGLKSRSRFGNFKSQKMGMSRPYFYLFRPYLSRNTTTSGINNMSYP